MIDWMQPREREKGGHTQSHTCVLGPRVRTGGRVVMARRNVEGVIMNRVWEGESHCQGCRATVQEFSEELS